MPSDMLADTEDNETRYSIFISCQVGELTFNRSQTSAELWRFRVTVNDAVNEFLAPCNRVLGVASGLGEDGNGFNDRHKHRLTLEEKQVLKTVWWKACSLSS